MAAFKDVLKKYLIPLNLPPKGTRKGYEEVIGQSPLFGTTDIGKVAEDFSGKQELWNSLVTEAEATLGVLPSREQFKERIIPFLKQEKEMLTSARPDVANRFEPQVSDRLTAAGLVLPGSSTGTPITAKYVRVKKDDGSYVNKKVVDVDAQVQRLIQTGEFEKAADILYDQTQNIARLVPQSMVDLARARGGSLFYPVRSARNKRWSELVGLPQRSIGRATSIGSANAGPYVEEVRTLALLPFLKVNKSGKVAFDFAGAERALGADAFKGPSGPRTGNLALIAQDLVRTLNDPDYLNAPGSGLANKTWVYDIMEADPGNPLAVVADNIGATGRTGITYATLPGSFTQSIYGQLPERVVAQVLGIQPSALQEIDWLVSRILRGEASSAIPFGRIIRESDMEQVAAGKLMHRPHSFNPAEADVERLSEITSRVTSKRPGGLVSQDVQDVAQANRANWSPPAGSTLYTPEGLPSRTSVEAIVEPGERTIRNGRNIKRAEAAIEAVRNLGPSAPALAIAAIVAGAGFQSLSDMLSTAGVSEEPNMNALRRLTTERRV